MIRNILLCFFQCVLFLVTFALGSFVLHPFHVQTALAPSATQTRVFIWDGVLMMLLLYGLVLVLELALKAIKRAAPWSTLAVLLAGLLGFLMKFGFLSTDR
jgi:hypothetical protein